MRRLIKHRPRNRFRPTPAPAPAPAQGKFQIPAGIQRQITRNGTRMPLQLITEDFYFYADPNESDEVAVMFRRSDNSLASNNYFAYEELTTIISERQHEVLWASKNTKYAMEQENKEASDDDTTDLPHTRAQFEDAPDQDTF